MIYQSGVGVRRLSDRREMRLFSFCFFFFFINICATGGKREGWCVILISGNYLLISTRTWIIIVLPTLETCVREKTRDYDNDTIVRVCWSVCTRNESHLDLRPTWITVLSRRAREVLVKSLHGSLWESSEMTGNTLLTPTVSEWSEYYFMFYGMRS